jgi:hypothetical protein
MNAMYARSADEIGAHGRRWCLHFNIHSVREVRELHISASGAPTWPEDFVSVGGTQKVYLSWDVPKCAPGCQDSWLGAQRHMILFAYICVRIQKELPFIS